MKTKTIKLKSGHTSRVEEACTLCDLFLVCKRNKVDCDLGLHEYWLIDEVSI